MRDFAETALPSLTCVYVVRVSWMPACAYACCVSELQSQRPIGSGPCGAVQLPPHWYIVPSCCIAQTIAFRARGSVSFGIL
ncbi:hypothetical protein SAURM35S_09923 [Streptomyces aurantiogriseus]